MKYLNSGKNSKSRLRMWLKILSVSNFVQSELRTNFRSEFDTTLPRFDVLAALDRFDEGLKMSELSKALRVSNGNVTGIIDRLIDDELVERRTIPGDRRASLVVLSIKGKAEFNKQAIAHEGWVDDLLSSLPGKDIDLLCEQFDGVIKDSENKDVPLKKTSSGGEK